MNIINKSYSIKKPIKITCVYAKKINNQKPKKKKCLLTNKSLKTTRLPHIQKNNNLNNEINISKSTSIATSKPKIINVTWFKDFRQSLSKMNTSITNDDNESSFLNYDLGTLNFSSSYNNSSNSINLSFENESFVNEDENILIKQNSVELIDFIQQNINDISKQLNSFYYNKDSCDIDNIEEFDSSEKINLIKKFKLNYEQ
jgi:hypothetical protein